MLPRETGEPKPENSGGRQGPGSGIKWLGWSIAHGEPSKMLHPAFIPMVEVREQFPPDPKAQKTDLAKRFELLRAQELL